MKVVAKSTPGSERPEPLIEDEPDANRCLLLGYFLDDSVGSEDLRLAALDRAEAGTPELNWANHATDTEMYPDGRVVISPLGFLLDEFERANPPKVVITIAEARKLILDWLAAEKEWYAARDARRRPADQPLAAADVATHPATNSDSRSD